MKTRFAKRSSNHGFTLVEVLFSTVIVAIALTSFAVANRSTVRISINASEQYRAMLLAQQKLNEFSYKIQKEGFDAFPKEQTGEFDEKDFPSTAWKISIRESGIEMLLGAGAGASEEEKEKAGVDEQGASVLGVANRFLGQSVRLIECEVTWGPEKRRRSVVLQTYISRVSADLAGMLQNMPKTGP